VEAIEYRYRLKVGQRTYYGPWLEYRNPVNIVPARILLVQYRATDVAGNVSEVGTHR
jgi:beta-glucosidase